jgi:hypothetical protein
MLITIVLLMSFLHILLKNQLLIILKLVHNFIISNITFRKKI